MSEATDTEILAAVERWARARGWLYGKDADRDRPWDVLMSQHEQVRLRPRPLGNSEYFEVDARTALLLACTIEAGLPPVDVGKCPACVKRGALGKPARHEWFMDTTHWSTKHVLEADGWTPSFVIPYGTNGWFYRLVAWRPCPDCGGTGREHRDPARMVLGAVPRCSDCDDRGGLIVWRYASNKSPGNDLRDRHEWESAGWSVGDPIMVGRVKTWPVSRPCRSCEPARLARAHLHVQADQLQERAEDLGHWHALWLAGSSERKTGEQLQRLKAITLAQELARGQTDQCRPGRYYQMVAGDTAIRIIDRAYVGLGPYERINAIKAIGAHPLNREIKKHPSELILSPSWQRELFRAEWSFRPNWKENPRTDAERYQKGESFAVVYLPEIDELGLNLHRWPWEAPTDLGMNQHPHPDPLVPERRIVPLEIEISASQPTTITASSRIRSIQIGADIRAVFTAEYGQHRISHRGPHWYLLEDPAMPPSSIIEVQLEPGEPDARAVVILGLDAAQQGEQTDIRVTPERAFFHWQSTRPNETIEGP